MSTPEVNFNTALNSGGFSAEFIKQAKETAKANPSLYADLQKQAASIQSKNNEQMFASSPSSGLSAGGKYADKLTNVPDVLPANNQNVGVLGALASAVQNLFGNQAAQKSNSVSSTNTEASGIQAITEKALAGKELTKTERLLLESEAFNMDGVSGYNKDAKLPEGTTKEKIAEMQADINKTLKAGTPLSVEQKNNLSAIYNNTLQSSKLSEFSKLMGNVDSTKLTACLQEANKLGSLDTNNSSYKSLNADEKKALLLLAATTIEANPAEAKEDQNKHGVNPNSANIALGEMEQAKN